MVLGRHKIYRVSIVSPTYASLNHLLRIRLILVFTKSKIIWFCLHFILLCTSTLFLISYFSSSPIKWIPVAMHRLFLPRVLNVYISMARRDSIAKFGRQVNTEELHIETYFKGAYGYIL